MTPQGKVTRRMAWIIAKMRNEGAVIQEDRDAFLEKSHYYLMWKSSDGLYHAVTVTERMLDKLEESGLIKLTENRPVYGKDGRFITSEGVWDVC